jgi:hypothetical protein
MSPMILVDLEWYTITLSRNHVYAQITPSPSFQAWSSPTSTSQYPHQIYQSQESRLLTRQDSTKSTWKQWIPLERGSLGRLKRAGRCYDDSSSPPFSTGEGTTPITVAPVSSTMNSTSIPPNSKRYGSLERLPRAFLSPL